VKKITAYGDQWNDGKIQLSFTLPIEKGPRAKEAAAHLLLKMGFEDVQITSMDDLSESFTFFVAYGKSPAMIDLDEIEVIESEAPHWDMKEIDEMISEKIGHPIKVIGACIESDAHTVGIDAILNMKGYDGDYGLERYHYFETLNMGAQVSCERVAEMIRDFHADVVLISQIVTQNNLHLKNLTQLSDLLEAEGLREKIILICGGPRLDHKTALELGYDAGFGAGTVPSQVASFIVDTYLKKRSLI